MYGPPEAGHWCKPTSLEGDLNVWNLKGLFYATGLVRTGMVVTCHQDLHPKHEIGSIEVVFEQGGRRKGEEIEVEGSKKTAGVLRVFGVPVFFLATCQLRVRDAEARHCGYCGPLWTNWIKNTMNSHEEIAGFCSSTSLCRLPWERLKGVEFHSKASRLQGIY